MSQTSCSLRLWLSDGRGAGFRVPRYGRRVETGAATRLEIAHRNQAIVGLDHGETADLMDSAKPRIDGSLVPGRKVLIVDLALDASDDLIGEGLVAVLADGERGAMIRSW